jgi:hypothetical protein
MHGPVSLTTEILKRYAQKNIFQSFDRGPQTERRAVFWLLWHGSQIIEFVVDIEKQTLSVPALLPCLHTQSKMYADLKVFVSEFTSRPPDDSKSVDPAKIDIRIGNRRANVSILIEVKNRAFEYATHKLVQMIEDIFFVFLARHEPYRLEHFGPASRSAK